jgi:Tfp pilus assembly protein FimT
MNLYSRHLGITVIELLIVLAIVMILSAIGMPSIQRFASALALRNIAAGAQQTVQQARLLAMTSNSPITATLHDAKTCIGISDSGTCDCSQLGSCQVAGEHAVFRWQQSDITVKTIEKQGTKTFSFAPRLGTAMGTNGRVTLSNQDSAIALIVSALGRTRICLTHGNVGAIRTC